MNFQKPQLGLNPIISSGDRNLLKKSKTWDELYSSSELYVKSWLPLYEGLKTNRNIYEFSKIWVTSWSSIFDSSLVLTSQCLRFETCMCLLTYGCSLIMKGNELKKKKNFLSEVFLRAAGIFNYIEETELYFWKVRKSKEFPDIQNSTIKGLACYSMAEANRISAQKIKNNNVRNKVLLYSAFKYLNCSIHWSKVKEIPSSFIKTMETKSNYMFYIYYLNLGLQNNNKKEFSYAYYYMKKAKEHLEKTTIDSTEIQKKVESLGMVCGYEETKPKMEFEVIEYSPPIAFEEYFILPRDEEEN